MHPIQRDRSPEAEIDDHDEPDEEATRLRGSALSDEPRTPAYGAGGGPTIRAVTLGALSVPVPVHRVVQELPERPAPPPPARPGWVLVLAGAALGVVGTLLLLAVLKLAFG